MPTSGGSSESETSELTVSPARRPPASATTTETPVGQRRKSARCSAPRSSTVPSVASCLVRLALVVLQPCDLEVRGLVGGLVVGAGRRALPHHVRRDAGTEDRRAVLRAVAGRMRTVRVEAVTEDARVRVRQEAVLADPARAVLRVERVDVEIAPERVERRARGGRLEAEDRAVAVREGAEEVIPLVPGPVRLDLQLRRRAQPVCEVDLPGRLHS